MSTDPSRIMHFVLWVSLAFSIWMLVDAVRRRADFFWYILIAFLMPLGGLAYFFVVKLQNWQPSASEENEGSPSFGSSSEAPHRKPPSARELARADELEARDQYLEAIPVYRAALEANPKDLQALHGLARCELGLGHTSAAVEHFDQLLNEDREYRDFAAALDYADALWQDRQQEESLELLEALAQFTERLNHRLAHAHYLSLAGKTEEAREQVQSALMAYNAAPPDVQARDKRWVEHAEQMLVEFGLER